MSRSKTFWLTVLSLPLLAGAVLAGISFWPVQARPKVETRRTILGESLEESARAGFGLYCSSCHTAGRSGADFNETTLQVSVMRRERATWELAAKKLRNRKMPPRGFPQPTEEDRADMIRWIEKEVLADGPDSTGPLMARRLLRSEYQNAVHELFGVALELPAELPADDRGWDRCANVPVLAEPMKEQYHAAAERVVEAALAEELAGIDPTECAAEDPESPSLRVSARALHLFVCDSTAKPAAEQARATLASFAQRAFSRPIESSEEDRLAAIFEGVVKGGGRYEDGIRAALMEILTSPHFLFRFETRGDAKSPPTGPPTSEAHALAARLSFFLWSSLPDQELLREADKGLAPPALEAQAKRLLKNPRAQALAVDFARHWLALDRLDTLRADDKPLAHAMRRETEHFFAAILREDRSVLDFLDADYTFLNETLAKHYGLAGVSGEPMRRVALAGGQRGGLLAQASLLTINSAYHESSPVLRGKWVMENLLGFAPIRPPVTVIEALQKSPRSLGPMSMRQQLEKHRTDPSCAACHARMDSIGLALENFGPTGAWRTEANGHPIDPAAELPDGVTLNGPAGLKAYLLEHRSQFVRSLSERLLAYALGRKLTDHDRAALEHIPDRVAAQQYHFSSVILEVAQSAPFLAGWRGMERR